MDAKIAKENESNEGGTMWSDRKDRQLYCIVGKKRA